jgi:hypothetical protein
MCQNMLINDLLSKGMLLSWYLFALPSFLDMQLFSSVVLIEIIFVYMLTFVSLCQDNVIQIFVAILW